MNPEHPFGKPRPSGRGAVTKPGKKQGAQTERAFAFIKAEVEAGRGVPTAAAIDRHMGWVGGGNDCLIRLVNWGRLRIKERKQINGQWRLNCELAEERVA